MANQDKDSFKVKISGEIRGHNRIATVEVHFTPNSRVRELNHDSLSALTRDLADLLTNSSYEEE